MRVIGSIGWDLEYRLCTGMQSRGYDIILPVINNGCNPM